MATAGDSGRDERADENPDLARKRQRMSEETELSPLSSNVEAVPPDEGDTSIHTPPELERDADMADSSYIEAFALEDGTASPAQQLRNVRHTLHTRNRTNSDHFENLSRWLRDHLDSTTDDTFEVWRAKYCSDAEFFNELAELSFVILSHGGEFGNISTTVKDRLAPAFESFVGDLVTLSTRMIFILPFTIEQIVSRRDSGLVKSRQNVPLIVYIQVLAQILALHRTDFYYLTDILGYMPRREATGYRQRFLTSSSRMASLATLLAALGEQSEAIYGWHAIDAILHIVKAFCAEDGIAAVGEHLHHLITTIQEQLLPVACRTNPRVLPNGYHEILVNTACNLLAILAHNANMDQTAELYDKYVKSDSDALLPGPPDMSIAMRLQELGNDSPGVLEGLLRTSWNLQALRRYIISEIMDVRASGIAQLNKLLLRLYNSLKSDQDGFDHPILQYVGRFMHQTELIKTIFNPDSHVSLVSNSQNIIGFLAVTLLYTNNDTDIIWNACMTSVDAEFKRVTFGVLTELCKYLDLDNLLYLAQKFAHEPMEKLGKDAVDTLTDLFEKVQLKITEAEDHDPERRLVTAFVSLDILYKAGAAEDTPATRQLRDTARAELLRFTHPNYIANDRVKIYQRCAPNLLTPADGSTTSIDIILLFLDSFTVCQSDSRALLDLLSVGALVDELSSYIETRRPGVSETDKSIIAAVECRVDAIIRFQALAATWNSDSLMENSTLATFTSCTVGELAINNLARDCAWAMLGDMATYGDSIGNTAEGVLSFCLEEALNLPPDCVTPNLLRLQHELLQRRSKDDDLRTDFTLVLQSDSWKQLLRTAESNLCSFETSALSQDLLCKVLFNCPLENHDKSKVLKCHADFTSTQIDEVVEQFQALSPPPHDAESRDINKKIDLLAEVLRRSKQTADAFKVSTMQEISLATAPKRDQLRCTLQVYEGGQAEPRQYRLILDASTRLVELANEMPWITGTKVNRLIVGGQQIDLISQGTERMFELGIGHKIGVISICPKHTFQSDVQILLTPTGEVEEQLVAHFDQLEKLLDGPCEIAEKMCTLLSHVCPPALSRQRVVTAGLSESDLFPHDRIWRSAFTIHILSTHLNDYASHGVADETFLLRGISLLVDVIIEKGRPIEPIVFERAIACLVLFLRERPSSSTTARVIKSHQQFVTRMIQVCNYALKCTFENGAFRQRMVKIVFEALIEAFRRQSSIWQSFRDHAHILAMHQQLLLHSDTFLVDQITGIIKNFCEDPATTDEVTDRYMNIGLAILPHALDVDSATSFFDLATQTLSTNQLLRKDEARAREVCQSLISILGNYQHSESVDMPLADTTMSGLLKLLTEAISVVQSFKKPLGMDGLAVKLFSLLLFSPSKDSSARPLVDQGSRSLAYALVQSTCESQNEMEALLAATSQSMQIVENNTGQAYSSKSLWQRPAWQCSGLVNLGQTCYMNSILQQLFANVHFRKFMFEIPITDPAKQNLIYQVQLLFAHMQNDYDVVSRTFELAKVLDIDFITQQDVHDFLGVFLERLEENMPDEPSKLALSRFFSGTSISQTKGDCGHVSTSKAETFLSLPMVVKNKDNLQDSLDEMVQGQPMAGANKYKCSSCDGRLVDAMMRTCLENLPDNLTFCLKRFEYHLHGSKLNDRFEFPQTIDMSHWQLDHLSKPTDKINDDIFELVGVIVHQGQLQSGHYWSYTLLRSTGVPDSRTWVKLEDSRVSTCHGGVEEVQRECFGGLCNNGNERTDNAYVLFYQRKESLEQQIGVSEPVRHTAMGSSLPCKVKIPTALEKGIHDLNEWRTLVDNVFDVDFHSHVQWLLLNHNNFSPASPDEDGTLRPAASPPSKAALVKGISEVVTTHIQRVLVCDLTAHDRLSQTVQALKDLHTSVPYSATCVLLQLAKDQDRMFHVFKHSDEMVREKTLDLVLSCLSVVKEYDETSYRQAFNLIRDAHSRVMSTVEILNLDLHFYLNFALAGLADRGPWETSSILDGGYLTWTLEALYTLVPKAPKSDLPGLTEHLGKHPEKVTILFRFVKTVLDMNVVVLPEIEKHMDTSSTDHEVTDAGVFLSRMEAELLERMSEPGDQFMWMHCAKRAVWTCLWRQFAPGELMGLLLSPKYRHKFGDRVMLSLQAHIVNEKYVLKSLLHLVLQFCNNTPDSESVPIFHSMAKSIDDWDKPEIAFLGTVRDAHKLSPYAVVSSIEHWGADFLLSRNAVARNDTAKWLEEAVFTAEPIITNFPQLDASCVSQTRKLVQKCVPILEKAYKQQVSREKYEQTISTMQAAAKYLVRIQLAGKARSQSSHERVRASMSKELTIELAELQRSLDLLKTMEEFVEDWEDASLPVLRPSGARLGSRMSPEPAYDDDAYSDSEEYGEEDEYGVS